MVYFINQRYFDILSQCISEYRVTQNHIQKQATYDSSVLNTAEQMNVADVVL